MGSDIKVSIADFDLGSPIGKGGFGRIFPGTVIRGVHTDSVFAVKVIEKRVVAERRQEVALSRERQALEQVRGTSPYLLQLRFAFQDEDCAYIVTDLCPGGDLFALMRQRTEHVLAEFEAQYALACMVLALEHMHAANMVHRDVKPENMLVDSKGRIVLADFGVAAPLCSEGLCRDTSGTPPYMAPEMFMDGHVHGPPADVYALGVSAHQMLTGHRPYVASEPVRRELSRWARKHPPSEIPIGPISRQMLQIARQRLTEVPETVAGPRLGPLSPAARSFIRDCLVANPAYRLGCGVDGWQGWAEVKAHPFFAGFPWDALAQDRVRSPFSHMVQSVAALETAFALRTATDPPSVPSDAPTAGLGRAHLSLDLPHFTYEDPLDTPAHVISVASVGAARGGGSCSTGMAGTWLGGSFVPDPFATSDDGQRRLVRRVGGRHAKTVPSTEARTARLAEAAGGGATSGSGRPSVDLTVGHHHRPAPIAIGAAPVAHASAARAFHPLHPATGDVATPAGVGLSTTSTMSEQAGVATGSTRLPDSPSRISAIDLTAQSPHTIAPVPGKSPAIPLPAVDESAESSSHSSDSRSKPRTLPPHPRHPDSSPFPSATRQSSEDAAPFPATMLAEPPLPLPEDALVAAATALGDVPESTALEPYLLPRT